MRYLLLFIIVARAAAWGHECPPECECSCPCCAPPGADPWPLGAIQVPLGPGGSDGQAIPGWESVGWTVTAESLEAPRHGWFAVREPAGAATKLLIATTGSSGNTYWTAQSPEAAALADELTAEGWRIVQIRHHGNWWTGWNGVDTGVAHLAVAPATAITYALAEWGDGIEAVAAGNSAGGAQIAYCLTHYGLDGLLDRVVVSGGPPFAALVGTGIGDPDYVLNSTKHAQLDRSHGYWSNGPVYLHDPDLDGVDWVARWTAECIADGALDLTYTTDVRLVQGGNDALHAGIGQRWADAQSPAPVVETVPGVGHKLYEDQGAVDAIAAHIRGQ